MSERSHSSAADIIIIPDPSRAPDRHAKTALALFHGDTISPLSRAHVEQEEEEEGSSSRDNIDHEIAAEESGDSFPSFFPPSPSLSILLYFYPPSLLPLFLSRAPHRFPSCTHAPTYACTSRADRSRASFEKQCKRERHAGLSFLPTFLLAHIVVPGSCSPPVPLSTGLSLSVYLVVSLSLFPSPPATRSFSFSTFLSRDLGHRYACVSFALLRLGCSVNEVQPSSSDVIRPPSLALHFLLSLLSVTNPPTFPLRLSEMFPVAPDSPLLAFRSMPLRLLQFNLIRQNPSFIIEAVSGKGMCATVCAVSPPRLACWIE